MNARSDAGAWRARRAGWRLVEVARPPDPRVFAAAVPGEAIAAALGARVCRFVVLGYAHPDAGGPVVGGGVLRIDGRGVPTVWGLGSGMAVVATSDLRSALGRPGDPVVIQCDRAGWTAYADAPAAALRRLLQPPPPGVRRFGYYHDPGTGG